MGESDLIGETLSHYRITAAIGAGGMGEVFRARDTRLDRDVALKRLPAAFASDPDRLARFEREAKLLASLNHPNIAHLYGFEEAVLPDGSRAHLLAMELVEGEDLAERLERGPVPTEDAVAIARQIAEALEEAHEKGIVHRDLKPANVKLTPDGKVKVLDFGLAKAWSADGSGVTSNADFSQSPTLAHTGTAAGLILGTAAYMSPEQARARPVDKRADIWAFGVVLYEMLTGRRLFDGETVSDVLASVLKTEPDWNALPGATPANLRTLLARCLQRDPKLRLRDIGEARVALADARPSDPALEPTPAAGRSSRRASLPWAIAALAVVAATVWTMARGPRDGRGGPVEVVHLELAFPADVEPVAGRQGGIAIAPDGSAIAMVGFRQSQRRLFVRRLDSSEPTDVGATSGGGAFSPDSRSVTFVTASTALSRVSLADGQLKRLTTGGDFVNGVSLAWGEKDVFFTRQGALWAVPAAGGEVRSLTTLDSSAGEVLHSDPLVLPGGRILLFSRLTTSPGNERIEAVPVGGGPRSVVVEAATTPIWSPSGHLLFARAGAVWAVPFDADKAATTGAAVPVIRSGVVGTVRTGSLGFQLASNGTLAFIPADFDSQRIVSVDRDGSERPLRLAAAGYGTPRISPDGRTVAVVRDGSVLESIDLARGTTAVAVPAAVGTVFPTWTSDGARIVVRRFTVPFWSAADGSGRSGLVPYGETNTSPAAAGPDAASFLAIRQTPETGADLYLMSVEGKFPPKPLIATPAYEGSPQLSPDRRWLVYQSNASGQPEIYVRRYPQLDRAWPVSEGGGVQCRWSPTGREIFYRGNGTVASVAFDGADAEPRLGRPVPLFEDVYDFGQGLSIPNYDVAPDGRFLMLRRSGRGGTLRVVLHWTEELKKTIAAGGVR